MDCCPILNRLEIKYREGWRRCAAAIGDLSEVIGEFLFFDDEKAIFIRLNQPKVMKSLHKQADPRAGRAHHLGEFPAIGQGLCVPLPNLRELWQMMKKASDYFP